MAHFGRLHAREERPNNLFFVASGDCFRAAGDSPRAASDPLGAASDLPRTIDHLPRVADDPLRVPRYDNTQMRLLETIKLSN